MKITTANLNSLDLDALKEATSECSQEVCEKAAEISNDINTVLNKYTTARNGVDYFAGDTSEAIFIAAVSVAIAIRSACFPESMPSELRTTLEATKRERERGN